MFSPGSFGRPVRTMPAPAHPDLEAGKVYRTRDLTAWGANPTRLAKRLLSEGQLRQLAHGLFYSPRPSRFGPVPPTDEEILRGFLGTDDFVITGPPWWNALGLGTTAAFPVTLAYNSKRSGEFRFGSRRFQLRRIRYPRQPSAEWFVVDLIEHHEMAGASLADIERAIARALEERRFDAAKLRMTASEYGTADTRALIGRCLAAAAAR
jgi:hypothetical protein